MKKLIICFVIFITGISYTNLQSTEINHSDLPELNLILCEKSINIREKYNNDIIQQAKNPILKNSQINIGVGFLPGNDEVINFQIEYITFLNNYFSILAGLNGYIPDELTFKVIPFYNLNIVKNNLMLSVGGGVQLGTESSVNSILSGRFSYKFEKIILGLEVSKPFLFKGNYPEAPFINFNLGFTF